MLSAGQVKNTYGTGCFMLMNTGQDEASKNGLLTTVGYKFGSAATCYASRGSRLPGHWCNGFATTSA